MAPYGELRTSDIRTDSIWEVVGKQWLQNEGKEWHKQVTADRKADRAKLQALRTIAEGSENPGRESEILIDLEEHEEPEQHPKSPPFPSGPEEQIYHEMQFSKTGMTITALAKGLSITGPQPRLSENMMWANQFYRREMVYLFRPKEKLSILVAWGGKNQDFSLVFNPDSYIFDSKKGLPDGRRGMDKDTGHLSNSDTKPDGSSSDCSELLKLQLDHPAFRTDIDAIEISILDPRRYFGSHDSEFNRKVKAAAAAAQKQMTPMLENLVKDLRSFKALKFIRIVLIGMGCGQSFQQGGFPYDALMPFTDLLDIGVKLGIQLQMRGSLKLAEDSKGLRVEEVHMAMNDGQASDFESALTNRRYSLAKPSIDIVIDEEDLTTMVWSEPEDDGLYPEFYQS